MGCASPASQPTATSAPNIPFELDLKIEPREAATFLLNPTPIGKAGYPQGMTVTIDILPKQGWQLDKWVGPVINIDGTTAQIEMNSSQSVAVLLKSTTPPPPMPTDTPIPATKTPIPPTKTPTPTPVPPTNFTLTTRAYPNAGGTVLGSGVYKNGSSATVTANPKKGYEFSSWSGVCSGTGRCVVTMNRNKSVTANFVRAATPTPTISSTAFKLRDLLYGTATPEPTSSFFKNPSMWATATPVPRPSWPSNRIDSLNATVNNVRFYLGDDENIELEDREYNAFFKPNDTKYLAVYGYKHLRWELSFTYPLSYTDRTFTVHTQWFREGKRINRVDAKFEIPKTWTGSVHNHPIWLQGGLSVGDYEIDFYVEGDLIARGKFEIYD